MVGDVVTKSSIAAKAIARSRDIASRDTQLQSLIPDASVYEQASANNLSCAEMIDCILSAYSDREALGTRDYEVVESPESSDKIREYKRGFRTQTYGDIRSDIRTIASAWRHVPTLTLAPDEFLIILGFASSEYFALDCAASYAQGVSVPMQIASSGADLDDIFERIQPSALATSFEDLSGAIDLASRHKSLRSLIIFDIDLAVNEERQAFEAARQTLAPKNIRVVAYAELIEAGKKHEFAFLPPHPEGDDRLALIIHSSGSTGVPKGAMISEGTVKQYWISAPEKHPTISVIFSPLNHLLGRATLLQTLGKGSTAYFTLAPDMSTLFEDIRLARPTQLTFFRACWI